MSDDDLARQMALAVLDGDGPASYALCDWLAESRAGGVTPPETARRLHPDVAEYADAFVGWATAKRFDQALSRAFAAVKDRPKRWTAGQWLALRALLSAHEPLDFHQYSYLGWAMVCLEQFWLEWEPQIGRYAAYRVAMTGLVLPSSLAAYGVSKMSQLPGVGGTTLKNLTAMLARHGLRWKEDPR